MISQQYKFSWQQIVLPILQSLNSCIELLVRNCILFISLIQFIAKECYRLTFLASNCFNG